MLNTYILDKRRNVYSACNKNVITRLSSSLNGIVNDHKQWRNRRVCKSLQIASLIYITSSIKEVYYFIFVVDPQHVRVQNFSNFDHEIKNLCPYVYWVAKLWITVYILKNDCK
jgi:hypothetical protein